MGIFIIILFVNVVIEFVFINIVLIWNWIYVIIGLVKFYKVIFVYECRVLFDNFSLLVFVKLVMVSYIMVVRSGFIYLDMFKLIGFVSVWMSFVVNKVIKESFINLKGVFIKSC